MKLILVMTIGICIYDDEEAEEIRYFRCQARKWIHAAVSWISAPLEKDRLNIQGLQVQCLLHLARQVYGVGGNLVWVSTGTLLNTALFMGLNRDPRYFPLMTVFHAEMRRRLWATILEMVLQSSLDIGMRPLISIDDFDTDPPSNIDDDQIHEKTPAPLRAKPATSITSTSVQISLYQSSRLRLQIAQLVNDNRQEPTYEEVLRLSNDLISASRQLSPSPTTSQTHTSLYQHFFRRFFLSLHRPFAFKARTDPRYYFSRKVCIENAVSLLSPPDSAYTRLITTGFGMLREVPIQAAMFLCLELIYQLEEDQRSMNLAMNQTQRLPLVEVIRKSIDRQKERIRLVDFNIKGYVFLFIALAQIEAMQAEIDPRGTMVEAAIESVETSFQLMKARIDANNRNGRGDRVEVSQTMDDETFVDAAVQGIDFDLFHQWDGNEMDHATSWLFPNWRVPNM